MRTNIKSATIDDVVAGTEHFSEEVYVRTKNGYRMKDDILKNVNEDAAFRWENGGKEIHDKWLADPTFAETDEFRNYFAKWDIECPSCV